MVYVPTMRINSVKYKCVSTLPWKQFPLFNCSINFHNLHRIVIFVHKHDSRKFYFHKL